MSRAKHYLTRNVACRRPRALAFLAVSSVADELDTVNQVAEEFTSATCCVWRRDSRDRVVLEPPREFSTPGAFWDYLCGRVRKRARWIVVSHDPARCLTLLQHVAELRRRGWTMSYPISTPRVSLIRWHNDTRTLLYVSHRNLFPFAHTPTASDAEACEEMRRAWIALIAFLDDNDLGDFRLTCGAQASSMFRHRFLQHQILVHAKRDVDAIERRACLGSLYKPFFHGEAPSNTYYYLDTNGMYAWCMRQNRLPWRLVSHAGQLPVPTLQRKLHQHLVVATVRVVTERPHYPVRHQGRTVFPVGEFVTTLTTPDLRRAIEHGEVVECLAAAWYDSAVLFSEFVDTLWSWRRQAAARGDYTIEKLCKLWLVSLYGKFGAHGYESRLVADWPAGVAFSGDLGDADTGEHSSFVAIAGSVWSRRKTGETRDSFPAIMAHVAAQARNRMFDLIERAGECNTFFSLADGLIVNRQGYEALTPEIDPDRLGALRLKQVSNQLLILSDVELETTDRVWRPGVPREAREIDSGVFVFNLRPNLTMLVRSGRADQYATVRRQVELQREVRSGTVLQSGWIAPLRLPER